MLAFSRITSVLFFLLSLSFLTCALPTSANSNALAVRGAAEDLTAQIGTLETDVNAALVSVDAVTVVDDLPAQCDILVAKINAVTEVVIALGEDITIDDATKAALVTKLAAIITTIVKSAIGLVTKFGLDAVVASLVGIDVAFQGLLSQLSICVSGIVTLVSQNVTGVDVSAANLGLLLNALGLASAASL